MTSAFEKFTEEFFGPNHEKHFLLEALSNYLSFGGNRILLTDPRTYP